MIPRETIDKVIATAKVEEVVADYVTLKRRGANLWGLCPFHNEKTASFSVSPSKGIYKCFGCGKAGNAIGFVMEIEQCGFADAVRQIAKKYHIEIEEREMTAEEQQRQDDRESMFVVNDFANKWFQSQLWDTDEGRAVGLGYFRERGLREDIVKKFQLGYSPEKGNPLAAAIKKAGYIEKYLINDPETKIGTGVCGKSEDGRLYDRFRDRVIFPIHTVSGKTVGFAGRILKKKENTGKYVNSPDSIIYSKTHELYGLFFAKHAIAREDLCYLVEGQMDAISMHQSGIENVVCSGGTALTMPQIRLIHRFTSNITVLYDGDAAGIHAALRGIDMFLEEGFNVKVVLLPEGEDPDSYAQSHNASDFIEYIHNNETDFIRFKTKLLGEAAGNDPHKRSELIKDIVTSIALIPDPITRSVYTKDCADQLHISEGLLNREVLRLRKDRREEHIKQNAQKEEEKKAQEIVSEATTEQAPQPQQQTASKLRQKFTENFLNLIQVIVRYGDEIMYENVDGSKLTAGDYIIGQLAADDIAAPTTLYQKILDEFNAHKNDAGFKAETFFKFHADPEISKIAIDLIADKYQLSSIFSTQSVSENVSVHVKKRSINEELCELVPKLLLELKYTVINERIDQLEQTLKQAQADGNWDLIRELLATQPQLLDIKNQIARTLGNRVIT
ncbi:MAG: DNA primase [Paludibacteraceae bacterium]|nr:DNA primase [Paludibacteraceae bacterium]MBP5641787.1 DNA primase [Paludibacteraceae bacterium]